MERNKLREIIRAYLYKERAEYSYIEDLNDEDLSMICIDGNFNFENFITSSSQ